VFGDTTAETAEDVIAVWDDLKKVEKPGRTSVLDGIPQGMPSLALASKVLGRAEKLGLIDGDAPPAIAVADEDELGSLLLAIVSSARAGGLDAERALRTTLRGLQEEMRDVEHDLRNGDQADAGVIGLPSAADEQYNQPRP
jgi:XTP/dITP diphosphohydrolase